jgi:DNA-binding response OmpR family regulator
VSTRASVDVAVPRHSADQIRVLLIEDEKKLAVSLQRQMERSGYDVQVANDGTKGFELATSRDYAIVLLDLCLRGMSGLEILAELRARGNTIPVIIVSARDSVSDRVHALGIGADDYLVKPFDANELFARIERLLARAGIPRDHVLHVADLKLDLIARTAFRGGKEIPLTGRLFALLEFMMRNKNQVLTRGRIAEQVLRLRFDPGTNIIDFHICNLRKAVDDGFSPKLIHTLHGEGFILREL